MIHEVALLEEEYPDDGSSNEGNNQVSVVISGGIKDRTYLTTITYFL